MSSTSVRRRRERRRAVLRRSTERVGSEGEGGRRSPVSQRGVLERRYGCGPGRGSGVRHMGGLEPGFMCPGAHLLGDTAGAAGPLGARSSPTVIPPYTPYTARICFEQQGTVLLLSHSPQQAVLSAGDQHTWCGFGPTHSF